MRRRQIIAGLPLAGAALFLPRPAAGMDRGDFPLATELAEAIAVETAAYGRTGSNRIEDEEAGEVTGRVGDIAHRLAASPVEGRDYQLAAALSLKWGLVAEGTYYSDYFEDRLICWAVDSILNGSPFDDDHVPMLWHIEGDDFPQRPSEAVLAAARLASVAEKRGGR